MRDMRHLCRCCTEKCDICTLQLRRESLQSTHVPTQEISRILVGETDARMYQLGKGERRKGAQSDFSLSIPNSPFVSGADRQERHGEVMEQPLYRDASPSEL